MAKAKSFTLKTFFSRPLVERLGRDLARVDPRFSERRFVKDASAGLESLELVERARHIGRALATHLPGPYPEALRVLLRSLGPELSGDEIIGAGMAPFYYLPHLSFVAERGLEHFDASLKAQYELTKRMSAESSMRAYLALDPERTFRTLERWANDANPHVRRLVSECTRPRLPWAARVAWLDAHPERVLALLARLKDDSSPMVRRSVANNLNDFARLIPELVVRTCASWLRAPTEERRALVEHALRGAVKRGDAGALRLLGFGGKPAVALEAIRFEPKRVAIGGRVTVSFELRSRSRESQALLVDLAVHFVKANGGSAPKVFKLKRITLPARGRCRLDANVSLAVHTTRVPRPGAHAVDVLVNGRTLHAGTFLVGPPGQ
ncbi:MAG TPA: DNA alkylation repair protein [Polyangiaceae bacterium]